MTEKYEIWTGDGSIIDGSVYDDANEALRRLLEYLGWDCRDGDGPWYFYGVEGAIYVYRSKSEMDADPDGAYAPCIRLVEIKR